MYVRAAKASVWLKYCINVTLDAGHLFPINFAVVRIL